MSRRAAALPPGMRSGRMASTSDLTDFALSVLMPPDWMLEGSCQYADPDLWFPDQGGPGVQAKSVCQACPVQADCLEYALDTRQEYGIWGGMSAEARAKLLAAKDKAAA